MADFRPARLDQPSRNQPAAADLACESEAVFWAEACGWVPGTGYCRNRDCAAACLFEPQRATEAHYVARWRRLRRALSLRRKVR